MSVVGVALLPVEPSGRGAVIPGRPSMSSKWAFLRLRRTAISSSARNCPQRGVVVDGDLVEAGGVGRIRALDGLRGLTALVVVIHHCVEASVVPVVEAESGTGSSGSSIVWWATHSPVHLLLLGPEPVCIFFVL